ncbi:hypothetical protein CVD28_12870 [Bacillus sp. M6-12]|nr:hypothetical protein CVD28_12870 [Bacillus sp. M6-12]
MTGETPQEHATRRLTCPARGKRSDWNGNQQTPLTGQKNNCRQTPFHRVCLQSERVNLFSFSFVLLIFHPQCL